MLGGFGDDPFAAEPLTGSGGVPDGAKPPASNAPSKRKREPGSRGVKQAEVGKTCFVKSCEDDKLVGKKWCCRHNRLYDNLWTQAKKSNETAAVQQAMSTPEGADHALSDFERDNPPHAKYARKSIIQWGQFKRVHVVSQCTRTPQRLQAVRVEAMVETMRAEDGMGGSRCQKIVEPVLDRAGD